MDPLFEIGPLGAVISCTLLTVWFVGSLYLWPDSRTLHRDAPLQIKRRFASVGLVCVTAILYLYYWARSPRDLFDVFAWMGIRFEGLIVAAVLPLLLTMLLFLGPLVMLYYDPPDWTLNTKVAKKVFLSSLQDLTWWRNYIVGPFTEEWVFRSCMCPLLFCAGIHWSYIVFLSPFFFGLAHMHHIVQHLHKKGSALTDAWLEVLFQLFYTTVFGSYSAFLFLRTGHILSPFLAHAFCNYMGFPDVGIVPEHPEKTKIIAAFVGGLVGFFIFLFPATTPWLYSSPFF